ncbi:MAG: translation initiation factor IF-3 [Anaerolineae bacterium]
MIKGSQRINEAIRAREVRLVDQSGKQLGIFPIEEALEIAQQSNLDLVEVAPHASPPVCRLLDYGKYLYERAKRQREARKAQKSTEIKEIRLRPKTGKHDLELKIKRVRAFLADGSKVKVRVLFRGREITHPEIGQQLLKKVATDLEDVATIEQAPRLEGRTMFMLLAPAT